MTQYDVPAFQFQPSQEAPNFSIPKDFLALRVPLPEAWDYHAEHNPNHPLFVYDNEQGQSTIITWKQASNATHRAARLIQSIQGENDLQMGDSESPTVVGILAVKDSLTYWALATGIMRAGYTCFVISPRNSVPAVKHLLQKTKCRVLFVSNDTAMQNLANDAVDGMEQIPTLVATPAFGDLYNESHVTRLPPFHVSMDAPILICHSSGSTSFPKPIAMSHRNLCFSTLSLYTGTPEDAQLAGKMGSAYAFPLFHGVGCICTMAWPAATGIVLSVIRPCDPPIQPTPETTLENMVATKCYFTIMVPSFIETWSKDAKAIAALKSIPDLNLGWGGGPLPQHAGDTMIENGVKTTCLYGTTEVMVLQKFSTSFPGKDWQYFELSPIIDVHLEPQGKPGFYKLIVLATSKFKPNVINCSVNGIPGYDTNDVLLQHPTKKGFWRIYGRADDQIMHSTGEKTNPGPMEHIINKHPSISGCLMFGRERFQTGVIVQPIQEKEFDPKDHDKLAAFRNEVWGSIEEANAFAPQHSRIFKEMIVVTHPDRPLQVTDKRTMKRQPNIIAYEAEINAAYDALENSARTDVEMPSTWDYANILKYVRELTLNVLGKNIGDEEDIFQKGGDSLQATSIRNSISRALRENKKDVSKLGQNLVYAHPTITSLASFITELTSGASNGAGADSIPEMLAMVAEFTQSFPVHKGSKPSPDLETILVTGTTGSLGTYILNTLINTPSVEKVYAFNRADKQGKRTLYERQKEALEEQGADVSVLESSKLVLVEGDTTAHDLGLSKELLDEIIGSVTAIIHNAWRVDFNLAVSSFKPLVKGARNLIDVALASPFYEPPRVVFISSVGTLLGWTESRAVPEQILTDPGIAAGAGYGESKWVTEQILMKANEQRGMRNVVVRLGQVCGNTNNGNWNIWEWFPALVQSAKLVNCLPEAKGVITWVPADRAAAAVVDMRLSSYPYLHLVHPRPVQFSSVITPLAHKLSVPLVTVKEWVAKLQAALEETANSGDAVKAAAENPALRLVDFYVGAAQAEEQGGKIQQAIVDGKGNVLEGEAFVRSRLETVRTVEVSKTMAELPMLGEEDVERFLAYWRKKGVL